MELLKLVFFIGYAFLGDKANRYLKYHLLNVRAEFYTDTGQYLIRRIITGCLLGWITIPVAILHYLAFGSKNSE